MKLVSNLRVTMVDIIIIIRLTITPRNCVNLVLLAPNVSITWIIDSNISRRRKRKTLKPHVQAEK